MTHHFVEGRLLEKQIVGGRNNKARNETSRDAHLQGRKVSVSPGFLVSAEEKQELLVGGICVVTCQPHLQIHAFTFEAFIAFHAKYFTSQVLFWIRGDSKLSFFCHNDRLLLNY